MSMPYIVFNGVNSAAAVPDMVISGLPEWTRAKRRYIAEEVADRDGRVFMSSKPYDTYGVTLRVNVPKDALRSAMAYLSGEGWLYTSRDTTLKYYVRFLESMNPTYNTAGDVTISVPIEVDPHPRINPDAQAITITQSGSTITNPGTYYSQPRLTIDGSGDFAITISNGTNSSAMFFSGVPEGGIVVDSELMDALNADGDALLNGCIGGESDDFFRIYPGVSTITWETGDSDIGNTGAITSVTIEPRWRCL